MSPCDLFKVVSVDIVVNLFDRIEEDADRFIMVQCVDDEGTVLRHVNKTVPFSFKKGRGIVNKIRREDLVEKTILICFVESFKSRGEKTERR